MTKGTIRHSGAYHSACATCKAQLSLQTSSFARASFARRWLDTEDGQLAFASHVCDPDDVADARANETARRITRQAQYSAETPVYLANMLNGSRR